MQIVQMEVQRFLMKIWTGQKGLLKPKSNFPEVQNRWESSKTAKLVTQLSLAGFARVFSSNKEAVNSTDRQAGR